MTDILLANATFYAGAEIGLVHDGDPVSIPEGPERDQLLEAGLLRPAPPADETGEVPKRRSHTRSTKED